MNFFITILQDIASLQGIPTQTLNQFFEKRKNSLREAILREIRQGDFSLISEDDKIAIAYKLYYSAMEGVAKNNLRLMCQIINGMEEKRRLTAPLFLKYTPILATLSEDEILVLSIMAQYHPLSIDKNRCARDEHNLR